MLSDSKIRGRGAPRIYFEESFKEMTLVSARERKEELEGPRSLMVCWGCVGGQGGEHHSPSLQEGSLEKNPMTSGLKWSQSNKRSGHQARETEGPPRRGGEHTCSVATFQISPPRLWRREGITALERRISGPFHPLAFRTVIPSHCPVHNHAHLL